MSEPKREYWYRFYHGECPLCGRDKSYKERVLGPKPYDPAERHILLDDSQTYDWCDVDV